MEKTKFTILGETGSGKTCYLLGMYYKMKQGRGGYSIIAPKYDDDTELSVRYKQLSDTSMGEDRFPNRTNQSSTYSFEVG